MLQNLGDKLKGMSGSSGKSRWVGYLILGALIVVAITVVMLSALFPARRAARLNPIVAMRQE